MVWASCVLDAACFRWCAQYDRLVEWKAKHGHTRVPFVAGELGWWVNTQRQSERKGRLLPKRKAKLDAIDFCFYPQERVRPLGGAGKGVAGMGAAEAPGSPPADRDETTRTVAVGAHGGASAAAGVPSVATGAAAICKKRKGEAVGVSTGRRPAGASSPPRRPAPIAAAHPPYVASATHYRQQVAAHGLDAPPPPPPSVCAGVLPLLVDGGRSEATTVGTLPRATSDGFLRVQDPGVVGGGLPGPWGLARVQTEAAGAEPRRTTSWEAPIASGTTPVVLSTSPWAVLPSAAPGQATPLPGLPEGDVTQPRLGSTKTVQQPAPFRMAGPFPQFRAFGEPVPAVAVRAVPVREQQLQSPRPTPATGAYPPSPSDRFLVRPRSPASSSSSSSSYAGIDMGHHRRLPLPLSSYVPPQGIPSVRHPPSRADVSAEPSAPGPTPATPHTTSTGSSSSPPPAVPPGQPLFPSLPLPPPAALLSWSGAPASGGMSLSPPVFTSRGTVPSPTDGSRRPAPPKLPPFSSLLSGTARAAPAPIGLTPTASAPLASGAAGPVTTWRSGSTPVRDKDGLPAAAAPFPAGSLAPRSGGGAWLSGQDREPAPPPSSAQLVAAPRH